MLRCSNMLPQSYSSVEYRRLIRHRWLELMGSCSFPAGQNLHHQRCGSNPPPHADHLLVFEKKKSALPSLLVQFFGNHNVIFTGSGHLNRKNSYVYVNVILSHPLLKNLGSFIELIKHLPMWRDSGHLYVLSKSVEEEPHC